MSSWAELTDPYTLSGGKDTSGNFPCCPSFDLLTEKAVTADVWIPPPPASWNHGLEGNLKDLRIRSLITNDLASISSYLVVKPACPIDT
jgi:hypothetical protein